MIRQLPAVPDSLADIGGRYRNRRVLVLGAAGFIGRWVARTLNAAGADLTLVVRHRGTSAPLLERWGVSGTVLEADLMREQALLDVCRQAQPSITFNLAGYGVDPGERDPSAAEAINCDLVAAVATTLSELRDPAWRGGDLVHVGSALEYGDVTGVLSEDMRHNPTTLYGQTKLRGAQRLEKISRDRGVRAVTARVFMVYGAGEHESRLLPLLIRGADSGDALPFTSGEQRRDFTYVEDVVEGLLRLGLCEALTGAPVNVATGRLTRVRDVIETAARQLGIEGARLQFGVLPARAEEMSAVTGVATARLRALTGWAPTTTIEDGVRRTILAARALVPGPPPPSSDGR